MDALDHHRLSLLSPFPSLFPSLPPLLSSLLYSCLPSLLPPLFSPSFSFLIPPFLTPSPSPSFSPPPSPSSSLLSSPLLPPLPFFSLKVRAAKQWLCYMCSPEHDVGLLCQREDWDKKLQELFMNDHEMEYVSVCLSVCLSVSLSVCLSVYLHVCLSVVLLLLSVPSFEDTNYRYPIPSSLLVPPCPGSSSFLSCHSP